ncbi:DUF2062 domain-containing protein [Aureibacter tunicatorum]|uniref:DUF2062 domain-containing protein n=1 Tax=Aureibacter tunicatorum TaxID=866807 RepID=A0AAE4BS16_9BACT|nr:DUF2062 domain-containing protein [Aureibacter tunicatorum]MDR6237867.1 hypothetical protein [Aureibacter tunicatorum]BDD02902.1 hypothetical protein AUTU_03850 [Aureibacter tunicatorum]
MKKQIRKIFSIEAAPESIARGFAIGSFVGMLPIPGFQMLVAMAIAAILKINKKAACLAVFNTNVFTGSFVFAFNFWLGKKILGYKLDYELPETLNLEYIKSIFMAGNKVFFSMMVGGLITGVFASALAYWLILKFKHKFPHQGNCEN